MATMLRLLVLVVVSACLMVQATAFIPMAGVLGRNSASRAWNKGPWDSSSSLLERNSGEADSPYSRNQDDVEEEGGEQPCVGLCYTLKLLRMAAEAERLNKQKRFDGYLYDFARKKKFDGYLYDFVGRK